ncbi:MAG: ABC transporter permease [Pseudonocardiaceae bacterium]
MKFRNRVRTRAFLKDNVDDALRGLVQATIAQQTITKALVRAGVDTSAVTAQAQVAVNTLDARSGDYGSRLAVGLISAGLLYFAIVIYGGSLAQGVLEEKTSRVIELLLATMRPWQLIAGKIIGVGAAGLLQFTPITILVVIPFVASFSIINNPTGTTAVLLSLVPFFAPILMPILIALGVASAWQVVLAAGLTVATTVVLAVLGGRVYANSVLRTGSRVRLRDALSRTP